MSVEDIQKVNALAQELLKKGLVSSRDEAVKRAQEMLNKEIVSANVPVKETSEKQSVAAGDSFEKLRNMLERTKEGIEAQMNGYKNALVALEREIHSLKDQVSKLKAGEPRAAQQTISVQEVRKPAEKEEKPKSHPRMGNYKSDQVSVEKMFYYGNKR